MTRGCTAGLVVLLLYALCGCASAPPPPPVAPPLPPEPRPIERARAPAGPEKLPIAIEKLVASQRDELADMSALANVVGDTRGRARAQREVQTLDTEFAAIIEGGYERGDSDALDDVVQKLLRLDTKLVLLHDNLRTANPDPGHPKARD